MDNCPTMIFLGSGAGANDTHKYTHPIRAVRREKIPDDVKIITYTEDENMLK